MTDDDSGIGGDGIPYRIRGLRSITDADLDIAIGKSEHSLGGGDILDEAGRRRAERQARLLIRLTWAVVFLTAFVVILTMAVVGLTLLILSRTPA